MAAKTWEADFRGEAVLASLAILPPEHAAEPDEAGLSYCLPVHEMPIVGWTPGKVTLIALILGFALLIAGAVIVSLAKEEPVLTTVGAICSLAGFACFWAYAFDRFILRRLLGPRGERLAEQSRLSALKSAEVSEAEHSKVTISIDGDDHVLILFDPTLQRVIMEGVAARYQILSADVVAIRPFGFMNYVGVDVEYRIGGRTNLRLAIAKVSLLSTLIQQAPIFFFLQRFIPNRLLKEFEAALGFEQRSVGQITS
jgi:hypothetical protein